MLRESQAAALLAKCEAIAGRRLDAVRGNLRKAKSRSAAVWELIVFEALAQLGAVEAESPGGGPDARLALPSGRHVWVETTYLYPRFIKHERLSELIVDWLREAAKRRFGESVQVGVDYFKHRSSTAGPVLKLPEEHERASFLKHPHIAALFNAFDANRSSPHVATLQDYSMRITIAPKGAKVFISNGGRPVLEAPWKVDQHAVFRKLTEKRRQHSVDEPRLIVIGSDTSPVIDDMLQSIKHQQALSAALSPNGDVSGILVVKIGHHFGTGVDAPVAVAKVFPVRDARNSLTEDEWQFLSQLNLNRWRYCYPSSPSHPDVPYQRALGSGIHKAYNQRRGTMTLRLSTALLLDSLAGRRNLLSVTQLPGNDDPMKLARLLDGTTTIVKCALHPGDQMRGEGPTIELEIADSHELVYWPRKVSS